MIGMHDLISQKYVSLETYKKNNQVVRTPVWFVIHDNLIFVITREKTGKVKRIKNNPCVKIASCTFKGKITGDWIPGIANKVIGKDSQLAINLRKQKYGFLAKIAEFASRGKGNLVVFSIKIE